MQLQHLKDIQQLLQKPAALAQKLNQFDKERITSPNTNQGERFLIEGASNDHPVVISSGGYFQRPVPPFRYKCFDGVQAATQGSKRGILGMETFSPLQHRRTCPSVSMKKSFHVYFQRAFPRWLLSKALHFHFSISYGAGGLSISPNMKLIPVVDVCNPAWDLMRGKRRTENGVTNEDQLIPRLRQLFLEGKASPFDVDLHGCNLVHVSCNL